MNTDKFNIAKRLDAFDSVPHRTDVMLLADGASIINVPTQANAVMIQAVAQNVNYTLDGTAPTATSGFALIAGNDPVILFLNSKGCVLTVHAAADSARLEMQFLQLD